MGEMTIRPLVADDAAEAWELAYNSLKTAGEAYGWEMPPLDETGLDRGKRRVLHVLQHDPEGSFVADDNGMLAGVGLATVRGPLWFLSLLTVKTDVQAKGVGRQLLDATLATLGSAGTICASDDPKALRRYRAAGFDLDPCYSAKGTLDRALLPVIDGVRAASYADDREFIEHVAVEQRGAPLGPDLDFFEQTGRPLYVTDTPEGRGYLVGTESGVGALSATTPAAAQALMWTALAETTAEKVEVLWMRRANQWALDVALAARLSLRPSGTFCVQGEVGGMEHYIPNGGLG